MRKQIHVLCAAGLFGLASAARAEEGDAISVEAALRKHLRLSESQAEEQAENVFTAIREQLKTGGAITVSGFGRFSVSTRQSRRTKKTAPEKLPPEATRRNSRRYPRFTSSASLKEELNSK